MGYSPNVNYRAVARRKAAKYGLDPGIFQRQIGVESNWYSPAVISGRQASSAGAQGIAQFMPSTAAGLGVNPLHPVEALDAAAKLMAGYVHKYGSYRNALVAYNAGPGRVGGPLPGETQHYVQEILGGQNPTRLNRPRAGARSGGRPVTITTSTSQQAAGLNVPPVDTSALAALLGSQQPQQPVTSYIPPPSTAANQSYLPAAGPALYSAEVPQQTDNGLAAKLAAISSLSPAPSLTAAGKSTKTTAVIPATGQPGSSPGIATPGSAPDALRTMIERANRIDSKHYNYEWGGGHNAGNTPSHGFGHGSGPGVGFDCSGVVSRVLGINPRVASQFESFGQAGRGKQVTIYANGTHTLIELNGHFFGTSGSNPGGGAGWIKRSALPPGYLRGFVARHPNGM